MVTLTAGLEFAVSDAIGLFCACQASLALPEPLGSSDCL